MTGAKVTKIAALFGPNRTRPTVSFEFFPPRTEAAEAQLDQAIRELEPLAPSFVSVTYGAGGSTRERTHDIVVRILRETAMIPMAHLTCAAHTRAELRDILSRYREAGIENILALRGDPPADLGLPPGDLAHATELIRLIREVGDFSVGVAAHPEGHPASTDPIEDLDRQAAKLAEADFAITQFFFDPALYVRLVDAMRARGVDTPVVPGIMPVTNLNQIKRMSELQGTPFPADLEAKLRAVGDDPDAVRQVGIGHAIDLCRTLLDTGAPGLHFYTLNRSTATREIAAHLDLE